MNGNRIRQAQTLEERLAAIAVALVHRSRRGFPPDYADFRDAFRPFAEAELAIAELKALDVPPRERMARKQELARKLAGIDLSGLLDKMDEAPKTGPPGRRLVEPGGSDT